MKDFIVKHKTQIISIITAISALALSLTSLGGEVTRVCEIVIAIDSFLIAILKTCFDAQLVDNSVALLKLLQNEYDITPTQAKEIVTKKIAGTSLPTNGTITIKQSDGSVLKIPKKVQFQNNDFVQLPTPIKNEKLTDKELKELVLSYLNQPTKQREDDNGEEDTNQ